jgi:tetratricopeptide (TPR) repeat protein
VALENHFAGLKIIQKLNAEEWYPTSYAGIANVYLNMGNFPEADKYLENAYSYALKSHKKSELGEILLYLGNSLFAQAKPDAALSNFTLALKYLDNQKNYSHLAEVYMGIANIYLRQAYTSKDSTSRKKNFLTSINFLVKKLMLDHTIGNKNQILKDYSELIETYTAIGDYKNALTYYDLYSQRFDSSYYKSPYLKISELKIKYEAGRAAAELRIQQEKEKIENVARQDKILAAQKLNQERAIAAEKSKYEKAIAEEKITQEKMRAEKKQLRNLILMGLILALITSAFIILFLKQRSQKKRDIEKAEAVSKMAELEMQSLRSQLNPHFMFNSLNSIQSLILKNENEISHSYLSRFAKLLRILLENADSPLIPLNKEIEFLHLYLGLESLRVPDLKYSIITDSTLDADQVLMPNMLLQPYVENAIWHGLSYKASDKNLHIRISKINSHVTYEVEDDGIGRKKAEEFKSVFRKQHKSKGMELINKRIHLLNDQYAAAIQTEIRDVIRNNEVAGTLVTIKIPLDFIRPLKI